MPRTVAIMLTMTTYGTWLRGDQRGWVDNGKILPPDPDLEAADQRRMKHPVYTFPRNRLLDIGNAMGRALVDRLNLAVLALTVQTWHAHVIIGATQHAVGVVSRCAKEAARYHLRPDRPIWSDSYDKRFCFDDPSVRRRVQYVERHNEQMGWPARPWPFIIPVDQYLASI